MRVFRPPLFATLSFVALVIASAGCGHPDDQLHALAEISATSTASFDTPTLAVTTTIAPETAETQTPITATPEPPVTREPSVTPTSPPTMGVEAVATRPPPCRKIQFSSGESITPADLAARGHGEPVRKPFLGVNLVIRKIGVDARFVVRVVGSDGMMPPVGNATDVAWYDFSQFPSLGGTPGTDHGNVIVAGDYDDFNVPQAVFFRLSELTRGDLVQINTSDGRTLAYEVEFNKVTAVDGIDWTELAASTPEESITLITAAAPLNNGRRIVWGRALDTGCSH
jgi:LPXTG-site transpeptidase (sortase) family protein